MNVAEVAKMTIPEQIEIECENIKQMLLQKNRAYGNSFVDPVRIFSKSTPEEGLLIRIVGWIANRVTAVACYTDSQLNQIYWRQNAISRW